MTNDLTVSNHASLAVFDSIAEDLDILRILQRYDRNAVNIAGDIVCRSPRFLYCCAVALLFPHISYYETIWGERKERYAEQYDKNSQRDWLLEEIEKSRKRYRRTPDVLQALDILEKLTQNSVSVKDTIQEKVDASRIRELREVFDKRFGDSYVHVVIRDRSSDWTTNATNIVAKLFTRPTQKAVIAGEKALKLRR